MLVSYRDKKNNRKNRIVGNCKLAAKGIGSVKIERFDNTNKWVGWSLRRK